MAKRILAVGKVVDGTVEIHAAPLEEQMDAQLERNAGQLAANNTLLDEMYADLDALQAKQVNSFRCSDTALDELLDAIENDYEFIRRGC